MAVYQIFVKHLDGKTRCLQFSTPILTGSTLKSHIHNFAQTLIPPHLLRLVTLSSEIHDATVLSAGESNLFPSCSVILRLRGGKGGFGSLLRGAATKAGQKKTNNFDACRDMSGRRLRHVNAEKKLEEWKATAEDRRLEKVAEQFLKKKAKEVKKSGKGSSGEVEKYIQKYKEDSERCMGEVEESVRQSFQLYEKKKRKVLPASGPEAKRFKIWLGKKAVDETDSDDYEDDDTDREEENSVVLNVGNQKDREGSAETVSGNQSCESLLTGEESSQSNVEQEKSGLCNDGSLEEEGGSGSRDSTDVSDDSLAPETTVQMQTSESSLHISSVDTAPESKYTPEKINILDTEELVSLKEVDLMRCSSDPRMLNNEQIDTQISADNYLKANLVSKKPLCPEPVINIEVNKWNATEEPLKFDEFYSATELEALGMDRLKTELQAKGLKCGGTLQERAARLFLLKSTPIENLPKKLLAKPVGGK